MTTMSLFSLDLADGGKAGRVSYADGGLVFLKGDIGDCAYLVADGHVEIREGGRVIETIAPGEMFGEMAMIDLEPRSASAVAVGAVELIRLDRDEFDRRIRHEPEFALKVMRLMSRRLRAALAAPPVEDVLPVGVPRLSA